ncbi:ABC transporter ATP-binding protein [Amycolatopsis jejuensis]|uniref:ABC transporter ATP-binding protein n=1 Tax=Amycolatopsis jejuensis TaxID=330084 RepID=UPI00068945F0|nr:ABC transporter ATP-binding protein [Amycolatopsis jejuensis]
MTTEPLLSAEDAGLTYPKAATAAVAGVTLSIRAGASIGIVGESGSGKSTLARMLAGVIRPTAGRVLAHGRPWSEINRSDPVRRSVQMIFQDPSSALNPWMTAQEAVAEVFRNWDRASVRESKERAGDLLAETGLTRSSMGRRPRELSGGQCQRVGIARALACAPDVLIADEPTSALDVSVQAQILNTILDLKETRGLALMLISHDLSVVRYMTESAVVMYHGTAVEMGPTEELLTSPSEEYTRQLVASVPEISA